MAPSLDRKNSENSELHERASKKAKTVPSPEKVMATVFWDSQDIIFTDYLEKGRSITGQYYADLLDRFDAELMKNMR